MSVRCLHGGGLFQTFPCGDSGHACADGTVGLCSRSGGPVCRPYFGGDDGRRSLYQNRYDRVYGGSPS